MGNKKRKKGAAKGHLFVQEKTGSSMRMNLGGVPEHNGEERTERIKKGAPKK